MKFRNRCLDEDPLGSNSVRETVKFKEDTRLTNTRTDGGKVYNFKIEGSTTIILYPSWKSSTDPALPFQVY